MSARKSKSLTASPGGGSPSFWVTCAVCSKMIPRSVSATHLENSCKISYPFIRNQIGHVIITEVPSNSKILELPFIESRHSRSMIFLSKEIITACRFVSFGWLILRVYEEEPGETVSSDFVPIALRVWPIPEANIISRTCSGAFVTDSAMSSSKILRWEGSFTLENMAVPPSSPFSSFPRLQQAVLEITCQDDADFVIPEDEESQIMQNFKRTFVNRVVTNGNVFRLPFYTLILEIRVKIPSSTHNERIEESFKQLKLDSANLQFYEITNESEFTLLNSGSPAPKISEIKQISLDDVGGLAVIIDEISSTIRYVLESSKDSIRSSLSAGILLHGHHGTGKSLLCQAICASFKLYTIQYHEFGTKNKSDDQDGVSPINTSLVALFSDAIRNCPSAVIIEDLDVVGTKASRSEANASFISQLRSQIERINAMEVEVIVLATCTELEAVDTTLRAPNIFGKEIEIPVPALNQREDILHKLVKSFSHNLTPGDIKHITSITHGFVGADLKSLLANSHLHALKIPSAANVINIRDIEECIKIVHPSAMKSILIDTPNVRWADIGGQKDLKFKLKQAIEWPLKHPESFKRLGITPPKGILMYGPPGCSKTMIAKAIATESGLNFISVKGSELFSKWVGESEKAVRSLFRKARQVSPCILFFDEIDSLGGERGSSSGGASNVHERVLAQLLIEIDGIEALKDVTIVAATNRPDIIDPALLRPGRLDRIIHVPLPDKETRREIFNIHFRKMPIAPDVDLQELVQLTERYSGAELTALCHEAALKALEENIESAVIQESHFMEALTLITPRTSQAQIEFYEKFSHSRSKSCTNLL